MEGGSPCPTSNGACLDVRVMDAERSALAVKVNHYRGPLYKRCCDRVGGVLDRREKVDRLGNRNAHSYEHGARVRPAHIATGEMNPRTARQRVR